MAVVKRVSVPVFHIYSLICPIDNEVRYIGVTRNPEMRLRGHINDKESNKEKINWINNLKRVGAKPIMDILESCNDREEAHNLEVKYYQKYKQTTFSKDPIKFRYKQTPDANDLETKWDLTIRIRKDDLDKIRQISNADKVTVDHEIINLISERYNMMLSKNWIKNSPTSIKGKKIGLTIRKAHDKQ